MRVCYFGSYSKSQDRNIIIIDGLKENNVDIFECHGNHNFLLNYPYLIVSYIKNRKYDAIIVGANDHYSIPLARIISRMSKIPLIFDVFISWYDTMVKDRKLSPRNSIKSKIYFDLDKYACKMSDTILVDSNQHAKYFYETFGVMEEKLKTVYVGANDEIFFPRGDIPISDKFNVLFYGTFIPLQGVEYIVKAAKLLEREQNIKFKVVGSGQTKNEVLKLSKKLDVRNITYVDWINYYKLPDEISRADVCLGIFGNTEKARRVIPNKAYQALAMRKPLITGNTNAIREVLTDNVNVKLCEMADAESLADNILLIKDDEKFATKIADNGYKLFNQRFTKREVGKEVKRILDKIVY